MKLIFSAALLLCILISPAHSQEDPQEPSIHSGMFESMFLSEHRKFLEIAKQANTELLFLGDSITHRWLTTGRNVWDKNFNQPTTANFGIEADKIQHVLWRITHGELDNIQPKNIILLIGTNNLDYTNDLEKLSGSIAKTVRTILEKVPRAHVILMGILPRKEFNKDIPALNQKLSKLATNPQTVFLDIGKKLADSDGNPSPKYYDPDKLHLSLAAYQVWAESLKPLLSERRE